MSYVGIPQGSKTYGGHWQASFTGDDSTVTFVLPESPVSENAIDVWVGNVFQSSDAYLVEGTNLTLSAAPEDGVPIYVKNRGKAKALDSITADSVGAAQMKTGSITPAKMAHGTANTIIKYVNGVATEVTHDELADPSDRANIIMNSFNISVNEGGTVHQMVDGFSDVFEDSTGIGTGLAYDSGLGLIENTDDITPITMTYESSSITGSDLTTYTFSSQALGTADADRMIILGIGGNGVGTPTPSTVTVAGITPTLIAESEDAGASGLTSYMYYAMVPTGTTGDVVVTWSGAMLECGCAIWRVIGGRQSGFVSTTASSSDPLNTIFTAPRGSVWAAYAQIPDGGATWTGDLTEDFDAVGETNRNHSGASKTSGFTGTTISANITVDMGTANGTVTAVGIRPKVLDGIVISNSQTAEAQPDNGYLVLNHEAIDATTINTDIKGWIARDDGRTFTTDFATDNDLVLASHGFVADDRVTVSTSAADLPAGLSEGVLYYVIDAGDTGDFQVSLTSGGAAITLTDDGSGTHTVTKWSQATLSDEGSGTSIVEGRISTDGKTYFGGLTGGGGLASAFDGTINAYASAATTTAYTEGAWVGVDWGEGNAQKVTRALVHSASDKSFANNIGSIHGTVLLMGSNTLPEAGNQTGYKLAELQFSPFGTGYEYADLTSTSDTAYRYHWIAFNWRGGNQTSGYGVSEVEFFGNTQVSDSILVGTADLSGDPTGTDMKYLVETLNTKEQRIHAAALQWS